MYAMNSKLAPLFALVCLIAPLAAEPVVRIHDGSAWKEIDEAAWQKLPRAEITAKARDGSDKRFSGVPFAEILKLAGAPAGNAIRGPEMNRMVLLTAADGYQVSFSLTELDESFRKQNIILADRVDGKALDDFEGSRMVVAGDDLRHSRWIRQVKQIILTRPIVPAP